MTGHRYSGLSGMNAASRTLFLIFVTLVLAACIVFTVGPNALARQWRLSFTQETQPLIQLYFANPVGLPTQAASGSVLPVSFWIVRQGAPDSEAIVSEILLVQPRRADDPLGSSHAQPEHCPGPRAGQHNGPRGGVRPFSARGSSASAASEHLLPTHHHLSFKYARTPKRA